MSLAKEIAAVIREELAKRGAQDVMEEIEVTIERMSKRIDIEVFRGEDTY